MTILEIEIHHQIQTRLPIFR